MSNNYDWVKNIGSQLVESVEVKIGGITVQSMYSCINCGKLCECSNMHMHSLWIEMTYGIKLNKFVCGDCMDLYIKEHIKCDICEKQDIYDELHRPYRIMDISKYGIKDNEKICDECINKYKKQCALCKIKWCIDKENVKEYFCDTCNMYENENIDENDNKQFKIEI